MSSPENPVALLERCFKDGKSSDWSNFATAAYPIIRSAVVGTLLRFTGSWQEQADDFSQDVYLRLTNDNFEKLRRFCGQEEPALKAYLGAVAVSVVVDSLRAQGAQKRGDGKTPENLDLVEFLAHDSGGGEQSVHRRLLWLDIERCLRRASTNTDRDVLIFFLYYRDGLSASAIANIPSVDLSAKGVESTIFRLTRFVKSCLEETQGSQGLQELPSAKGNSA